MNNHSAVATEITRELKASGLLQEAALVAGRWQYTGQQGFVSVLDPCTGAQVGRVPALGAGDIAGVVEAARKAQREWSARHPSERASRLAAWGTRVKDNAEALARLLTLEQGKPLREARAEIDYAAGFIDWYAQNGNFGAEERIDSHYPRASMSVCRVPVGVVLAVTPWNFPSAMVTRKVSAALAAGCSVILRPADETPFSAIALVLLAEAAGIDRAVLSVLTGRPEAIVDPLCAHPGIAALSFTGSTRVGKALISKAASTVKRTVMELGGNAPFIVLADADLNEVVPAAIRAKFTTSGQDCLAANRFFVHRSLYAEFVRRLAEAASALKVGSGFDESAQIGPLITEDAVARCETLVADAKNQGARIVTPDGWQPGGGRFFQPVVMADVKASMRIWREENFGPLAAVTDFVGIDDVVDAANDTEYGLIAYVFGRDREQVRLLGSRLEYGMLALNRVQVTGQQIPFGGIKQSGLGREGSLHGLKAFTELRYMCEQA